MSRVGRFRRSAVEHVHPYLHRFSRLLPSMRAPEDAETFLLVHQLVSLEAELDCALLRAERDGDGAWEALASLANTLRRTRARLLVRIDRRSPALAIHDAPLRACLEASSLRAELIDRIPDELAALRRAVRELPSAAESALAATAAAGGADLGVGLVLARVSKRVAGHPPDASVDPMRDIELLAESDEAGPALGAFALQARRAVRARDRLDSLLARTLRTSSAPALSKIERVVETVPPSGSEACSTAASLLSAVAGLRRPGWTRSRDVAAALAELDAKLGERVRERTVALEAEIDRCRLGESRTGRRGAVDELTGLPHRRVFRQRLEQTLLQRQRDGGLAALLFVDLEGFRRINETRGRDQGDDVLIEVARRLSRCTRRSDAATRLEAGADESVLLRQGGDEFMVFLSHLRAAEDVALVAQRVIDAIRAPLVVAREELHVGASMGIALYPMHGQDGEALIKTANAALYMAKSRQPGHFAFFDTRIHERIAEQLQLEDELRRGISSDQLVLHYQPKIDVATGAVDGVEALVRWQHPTRGLMLPNCFLPLAERSDLIHLLGRRVIEVACRQAAEWWRRDSPLRVAINLSAQQIAAGTLDEHVGSLLEATGLPAHLLEVEVTEAALENVGDAAIAQLRALRDRGARVTVEDFGTARTSADALEKLPVDTVKLDRAFVESLDENLGAIEKVVETARTLDLRIAAEGVEERDQVRRLVRVGCDVLQGFYFGAPSPSGETESANQQAEARFAESVGAS